MGLGSELGCTSDAGRLAETIMMRLFVFFLAIMWVTPALADFQAAAEYSAQYRGISMLVVQDGEIAFESYPDAGDAERAHAIASGTKSFVGIIAAAAVQDGLLDLDERVSDTITEWQGSPREEITVRQLMNLTSGHRPLQRPGRVPTNEVAVRARLAILPGRAFIYGAVPFQVFAEMMRRKLEGDPVEYLNRRVLEPIGVDIETWRRDRDGNAAFSTGVHLTARDWARFGEFILARGVWNGEPLVSPEAFEELFVGSEINPAYGLTFWLNDPVSPAYAAQTKPLDSSTDFWHHPDVFPGDMVMAAGAGNQRLFISWEDNIVVVRQAEGILGELLGRSLSWSDVRFWQLLEAPEGETPAVLPPFVIEEAAVEAGTVVALPSGGLVRLPPVASAEDEGGEDDEEPAEEDEEEVFVGPTF